MPPPNLTPPTLGEPFNAALADGFFGAGNLSFNISKSSRHAAEVRVQIVCDRPFGYFEYWFAASADGLTGSGWYNNVVAWVIIPTDLVSAGAPFVGTVIQDYNLAKTLAGGFTGKCYANTNGVFDLFINDPNKVGNFFVAVRTHPSFLYVSRQIVTADFSA